MFAVLIHLNSINAKQMIFLKQTESGQLEFALDDSRQLPLQYSSRRMGPIYVSGSQGKGDDFRDDWVDFFGRHKKEEKEKKVMKIIRTGKEDGINRVCAINLISETLLEMNFGLITNS